MKERTKQIGIYTKQHINLYFKEKGWKNIIFAFGIAMMVRLFAMTNVFERDMETRMVGLALACVCIWNGIFNSIQSICKERHIIKKEKSAGAHMSSYFVSHMCFQLFVCAVQAFMVLAAITFFAGYDKDVMFYVELYITFLLTTYAADILGLAVSCIVHNPTTAMTAMPFLLIVQLMFAGVLFTMNDSLTRLTISKSSMEAVFVSADYNNLTSYQGEMMKPMVESYIYALDLKEELKDAYGGAISNSISYDDEARIKDVILEKVDTMELASVEAVESRERNLGNLMANWGFLLLHAAVYAVVGVLFLERISKDKR